MPVELISLIKPKTSGGGLGEFPLVEDIDFLGGFQARADNTDRDSIFALNRKEGMHVYNISLDKIYRLGPTLLNGDWVEVSLGGGTSVALVREIFAYSDFTYSVSSGLSTVTISNPPVVTAGLLDLRDLWRNGIFVSTMVSGVPTSMGEWRLNGTTLEIFGDVTGTGDGFTVRYPV